MDDMNALERQLANVVQGALRPPRPVDASAIVRTATIGAPTDRLSAISRRFRGGSLPASAERGFSMFTALKFVAAAAIVALFGGFLLASITGDPQEVVPPAAASPSPQPSDEVVSIELPTEFSGRLSCFTYWQDGTTTNVVLGPMGEGNLVRRETRGGFFNFVVDEMSDPRFEGRWWAYLDADEYIYPGIDMDDHLTLTRGTQRIENDEGAWQGSAPGAHVPGAPLSTWELLELIGEGAYEGYTTLQWSNLVDDTCSCANPDNLCEWDIRGLVFEGEMPPVPE